jgi:hypothetical protein
MYEAQSLRTVRAIALFATPAYRRAKININTVLKDKKGPLRVLLLGVVYHTPE